MTVTRHIIIVTAFIVAASSLAVRVVYLGVTERDFLKEQGDARSLRSESIAAHRGMIFDRRGEPLAVSTPATAVWIDPSSVTLTDRDIARLANTLSLNVDRLTRSLERAGRSQFAYIKRQVDGEQLDRVKALQIEGLRFRNEYRRYYPAGEVTAHLVGITDVDENGLEGVELSFQADLTGIAGRQTMLRDRRGNLIRDVGIERAPRVGRELELSLDLRLQFFAYRELKAAVVSHRAVSGSMVVLDARTGEILVLINQPSYNPNELKHAVYDKIRNRAVTDQYEPGSTIKPFSVLAALESGVDEDWTVDTNPGYLQVGHKRVTDPVDRGVLSLADVLKYSSQVGTAKLALELEHRSIFDVLARAGFGVPAQSGLPGEAAGVLSDRDIGSDIVRAALAYGYGLSVTPLQLAKSYLTLATLGRSIPVSALKVAKPPRGRVVFDQNHVRTVLEMMQSVTDPDGTAPLARIPGFAIAGKTGTTRKVGRFGYDEERHVAMFAGLAPADAPRLVAVIVVNEPKGELNGGGTVAAPIFARVMARALQILNVEPRTTVRSGLPDAA